VTVVFQTTGQRPPIPLGRPLETEAGTDLKRFLSAVNTEFDGGSTGKPPHGFWFTKATELPLCTISVCGAMKKRGSDQNRCGRRKSC